MLRLHVCQSRCEDVRKVQQPSGRGLLFCGWVEREKPGAESNLFRLTNDPDFCCPMKRAGCGEAPMTHAAVELDRMNMLAVPLFETREEIELLAEVERAMVTQRGLGDSAKVIIQAMGGERLARFYERLSGARCACPERQAWLNKHFPYRPGTGFFGTLGAWLGEAVGLSKGV